MWRNLPCRPSRSCGHHGTACGSQCPGGRVSSRTPATCTHPLHTHTFLIYKTLWRIRDIYPGSNFFPSRMPDPNCLHPRSRIRTVSIPDPDPKKIENMIRVVHPGSRIRMMTFYPSRIPGSKRHRIPDPQHVLCCGSELFYPVSGLKKALGPWIQDPNPQQRI